MKIIVIGSGFGGLASAIRLRAQGHDVTIVEARDKPGGRAYVWEQDGFTFDGGPTIITAPWLLDDLFALGGKKTAEYVDLRPIDPFYNIRFDDGSVFRYNNDAVAIRRQIREFRASDLPGYEKFVRASEAIFKTGFALIDTPFSTLGSMLKYVPALIKLRAERSVAALANRYMKDARLRQVFSFHPLLVGGNPFDTTSVYALIHHLEQKWGVWFAMGGTGALVRALVQLFEDMGGVVRLSSPVGEIVIDERSGMASGVRLADGELMPCDAVVSNADLAFTYTNLVSAKFRKKNTDRRIKKLRYSMSLFVLYFGTDIQYPNMEHHEILMGPRYEGLLRDIFTNKTLSPDFSLYLHRPTATDPSLAPPGCDSWYVLSPVPNLEGDTNWEETAKAYRNRIVAYLEARYMPGLSKHIVSERRIDPRYFRDTLRSHVGNAFGIEPVLSQSAWFRPHNHSEDVPNLYFAGAGTHPGAGMPGVISSGKIVADLIGPADRAPSARVRPAPASAGATV